MDYSELLALRLPNFASGRTLGAKVDLHESMSWTAGQSARICSLLLVLILVFPLQKGLMSCAEPLTLHLTGHSLNAIVQLSKLAGSLQ